MTVDVLDLVLVAAVVVFAISGYRQGFIVGVLSFLGFIGGGVLGAKYAEPMHDTLVPSFNAALFGLLVVFGLASLGQVAATVIGAVARESIVWNPARVADHAGGAAVSGVSFLLVAWLVGTALAHSTMTTLSHQVQHSAVLTTVDDLMPGAARTWFSGFRRLLDRNGFPQVFGALGPERIVRVPPPDPRVANSRAAAVARGDVVKVLGIAHACSRQLEGSGFLYAPDRVMTNAHVVAGVRRPVVTFTDGTQRVARVVLYDPNTDVAVLAVPRVTRAPLTFSASAHAGDDAVIAGYPENGPFALTAARIRDRQSARGPNIYQSAQVTREIYSVFAQVLPGNSGGPLLAPDGRVYGVVFAAAVDDPRTGYALTAREVGADAKAGAHATAAVGTGRCD